MHRNIWDTIIVGGGSAGLSAALMLGRARRRALVIDAGNPRNRFAEHMHGVLGSEGLPPGELLARGRDEASRYGVEFVAGKATRVDDRGDGLELTTGDGAIHATRSLIVASGIVDDLPDLPGLAERWGRTALHCPYCHGWEVRDLRLGVLLASPLGLHQAELVRQWSDRVTVFSAALDGLPAETERRLRARGVEIVAEPIREVFGDEQAPASVRLADGREVPLDALFLAPAAHPGDAFLGPLGLDRADTPFGSFLAVDEMGRTGHERVWAVGNVVAPYANVPMSVGAGSLTGAAVNAALVDWDFETAARDPRAWPEIAPADYWEERYAGSERVWSGRANRVLSDIAATLPPGRALDLGCGEGGDVIWLAQHGWAATGADISPTAIRRAREAARAAGVADRARFVESDLALLPEAEVDLVTASFLHSPVELSRAEILRRAAERVAPGGHLLIISHASAPPWADAPHGHEHRFPTPEEELADLALDPAGWELVTAETRSREATGPDGQRGELDDVVVLLRRR